MWPLPATRILFGGAIISPATGTFGELMSEGVTCHDNLSALSIVSIATVQFEFKLHSKQKSVTVGCRLQHEFCRDKDFGLSIAPEKEVGTVGRQFAPAGWLGRQSSSVRPGWLAEQTAQLSSL